MGLVGLLRSPVLLVVLITFALVVGARDEDGTDSAGDQVADQAAEPEREALALATVTDSVVQPDPGTFEAPFLTVEEGGVLELPVGPGGTVDYLFEGDVVVEGTIRTDGRLEIRAANVLVAPGGSIQAKELGLRGVEMTADGDSQGGTIAIESPSPDEPGDIFVDPGSRLSASATAVGSGGSISLRARDHVDVFGDLAVTGGPLGGNGGRIHVDTHGGSSGITFEGGVDVSAPEGQPGRVFIGSTEQQVPDGGGGPLELSLTPAD